MFKLISRIALILCIISIANCFDVHKIFSKTVGNMTAEEVIKKLGIRTGEEKSHEKFLSYVKKNSIRGPYNNCESRKDYDLPDPFMFIPILKGKLANTGDKLSFGNHCFKTTNVEFEGYHDGVGRVGVTVSDPQDILCVDFMIFQTASIMEYRMIDYSGYMAVDIAMTEEQYNDMKVQGLRVWALCDDLISTVESIIATIEFFFGGPWAEERRKPYSFFDPKKMEGLSNDEREEKCLEFYEKFVGVRPELREGHEYDVLDVEPYIKSGDTFGTLKVTAGIGMGITYITGPPVGHSCICLRLDGKLHVVESNIDGIVMFTYEDYMEKQVRENNSVLWFSLSEENAKKFDTEKVYEWLKPRLGLPYGMSTFIPAPVDLTKDTLPEWWVPETVLLFFSIMQGVDQDLTDLVVTNFINNRIGTSGLNIIEASYEMSKKGLVFEEVMAMPELENYTYPGGEKWICSAIVTKMLMVGGVIQGDINPKEFVPRDVYQVKIYDPDFKNNRPDVCKEADPDENYCQIFGKYRMHTMRYNDIPIYDHMNDKCPFRPTEYIRPDGC